MKISGLSADCDPKYTDGGFNLPVLENCGAKKLAVASDRFVDKEFRDDMLPVLYSYRLGKGEVVFLPAVDPVGSHQVKYLYDFLMKSALEALEVYPKVECSDRIRFSVYAKKDGGKKLYLLNTEDRLEQSAIITPAKGAKEVRVTLKAGEIKGINL